MKKYKLLILIIIIFAGAQIALAGDIGNTTGHAWLEKLGWIKLSGAGATPDYGVTVGEAALSGYAWSEKTGWINFDDSGSNYGVLNDGAGNLSGYAWSEKLGYISFDDSSANDYYQVALTGYTDNTLEKSGTITLRTGTTLRTDTSLKPGEIVGAVSLFGGNAWSEVGGYINFDDAGDIYKSQTEWQAPAWSCGDSVEDIESNSYGTILIDSQCWMTENMRTTTYPDSSAITKGDSAHGDPDWGTDQAWYSCPPNSSNNGEDCAAADSLGMLYQWSAAMDGSTEAGGQGICPTGWHVPTDAEWHTLEDYLDEGTCNGSRDGSYDCSPAGSKLAGNDAADANWTAGTLTSHEDFDASGFNAPPAGSRSANGSYFDRAYYGIFWSSSEAPAGAWCRYLYYGNAGVNRSDYAKAYGFSVRCLKN